MNNYIKVYMHTIDGKPAEYIEGSQISFSGHVITRFAESLEQIRREQEKTRAYRDRNNCSLLGFEYGHCVLHIPVNTTVDQAGG